LEIYWIRLVTIWIKFGYIGEFGEIGKKLEEVWKKFGECLEIWGNLWRNLKIHGESDTNDNGSQVRHIPLEDMVVIEMKRIMIYNTLNTMKETMIQMLIK
jgi:hypothetical protein